MSTEHDTVFEENTGHSIPFDDETIIWEGGPSQVVNIWKYLGCLGTIAFSIYCLLQWHTDLYIGYESLTAIVNTIFQIMIIIPVLLVVYFYLEVKYEHTIISRNKILEQKGITRLFRQERYCELSDISDIESPPPGVLLGIFKLSDVVIETHDDDQPIITIRAIQNRDQLIHNLLPLWRKIKLERKGFFADR